MKTYWQAEVEKGPVYGLSDYVGTLIVETDGAEPPWEDISSLIFEASPTQSVEVRLPVRKSIHVDDRVLRQQPRLSGDTYKVWTLFPVNGDPDAAVPEDQ